MSVWSRVVSWFRAILGRKRSESEMDAELQFHLETRAEDLLRSGMPRGEAQRRARLEFGGIERMKEECREARGVHLIENFFQDFRFGLRVLRKNPGFTAVAVLTLALGIGVNTSIFSLVYSLALRSLPVRDPGSIVSVYEEFRGHYSRGVYGSPSLLSYPEYVHYRDGNHVFSGLAAFADDSLSLGGVTGQAVAGLLTSCNYFEVLGGEMAQGRGLSPEDCRTPGAGFVAVISNGFWKRNFASDPAVLGKKLRLNRQVFTVVGVAASNFGGTELQVPDVWLPLTIASKTLPNEFENPDWLTLSNVSWLNVVGRLNTGTSRRQAEAELAVLARQMDANFPGRQTTVRVNSGAYWNSPEARGAGALLATAILAAGCFILVIACMNVMNLLLARATTRYQETGVRLALGASRVRLMRQLLTETLLLVVLGGAASVIVAEWLPPLLVHAAPEMPINPQVDLTPNFEILTYTFLTSLLAAAVCGLAPALQATRLDLVSALKEEGFPVSGRLGLSRMRNWLIVAQVAGCTVLLIAAGLLVRGLRRAQSNSPGFFTKNVILISLDLANKGYDETRAAAFQRELHDRLAAVPGVAGVARSVVLPCVTGYTTAVKIPGSKADGGSQVVWANIVSADYFKTMGIGLLRGRIFTTEETRTHGAVPAVVSTAMARRYWPDTDPVGKEFLSSKITFRVLGIAPDVQNVRLGKLDGPFFYAANVPGSALDAKIFVRTFGDPSTVEAAVPQLARKIDANVLASAETFEQALEKVLEPSRTLAWLVATLGILAMVLAVVGVSGIVAYAASQRTHEIGIRKALGAHSRDIVMMLLRQGAKVASIGMAVGLGLAAGVSTMLSAAGLLFGLGALDPLTYLVTAVALVGATLLACYLPAQRATKVDPMVALRYE